MDPRYRLNVGLSAGHTYSGEHTRYAKQLIVGCRSHVASLSGHHRAPAERSATVTDLDCTARRMWRRHPLMYRC